MSITLEEFVEGVESLEDNYHDPEIARLFFANHYGKSWEGDFEEVFEDFLEAFNGVWDSEEAFAEHLADDLDMVREDDRYFDYKAFTRDLFIGDYWSESVPDGVAVFRNL